MHHAWRRDEDGEIDLAAVASDVFPYCQGPSCARCWEHFCVSCEKVSGSDIQELLADPCVDYSNPNQLDLFD